MLVAKFKKNLILDGLYPERQRQWVPPVRRKEGVHFDLSGFSFIDNPKDTLRQLRDIAVAECTARVGRLDFGDPQVRDIGPYVVWSLMSDGMAPFLQGGKMDIAVQKVFEAVGLRKFMRMAEFKGLKDHKDVWAFPLKQRNPGTPTAEPARAISFSRVADQLVDTVNDWLGALPVAFTLTEPARAHINKIATEMLENAERHGRPREVIGDWYVAGFMARRTPTEGTVSGSPWYDCHVAFVNMGTTIAENILGSTDERIRDDLEQYAVRHRSISGPSRATLATLYAMQDGVSSLPRGRGGMGMMEMVDMVNALGRTPEPTRQPAITIISGRSCIRFSGPFRNHRIIAGSKRVQPFNDQGSFDSPPDRRYVFDLDFGFPGTIVATRFALDYQAQKRRIDPDD